jgi:hypothetical protein
VAFGVVLVVALGDYVLDGKRRYKGPRTPLAIEAESNAEEVVEVKAKKMSSS